MSIVSASYTICDLSDGVATHFLNTTYSGTQATLENWGSTGGGNWSLSQITSDYSDVKVGDSCWMRCTNTTKNGYTYVGMVVSSITSSALVAGSGLGIIDKGDTGDDAISYWLEKSATIISKDTNNSNVLTPSSVTVTAKKNVGGTTSDFTTGTIKLYADGTEISPASSTSSSITFNPSASVSTYVIKLFSGSIELDAESIPIIATGKNGTNGVNAVTAVLTNDSAQVPTDSNGNNPDFTTATTTIEVYEGGNKVTPTSYGPHVCSNCTVNATNAASVTVTGMSANSVTVTLKATYGGKTYSKVFTVSKQKQGITGNPGANATSYWLEKSATIISKDVNNSNQLTPSSVTLTAYKNVGGTTSRFTAGVIKLYADGTEVTPAATETRTFTPLASVSQYIAKLYDGNVEVDVESIPIVATGLNGQPGSPGADAVFAILTNDSAQVPTDKDGNVPSGTVYPSSTIELYKGGTKVTATYPPLSSSDYTGCTISQSGATVTIASMTADYATVNLKAVYNTVTYSKQFTITKQKQGIQGNPGTNGANAVSYWIEKSTSIVSKNVNNSNVLTPNKLTLTAKYNEAGTTATFTTGVIKLWAGTDTSGSPVATSTSGVISNYTLSASVAIYTAILYSANNVELDKETVPIVDFGQNGTNGQDAMFAALTNDSAQVPADENGNVPSGTAYPSTTIELYKGATKQTSGVTYPAAAYVGCTISQSGGTVILTSMTADYATVTLKATYGGVTYSKQFTATKQKQGIHGNDGDSPTAYPQYALVYAGATPGTNDWQDERPQNWAVGYSYWTRTKYVYSPTRTEYSTAIEDTTYNQYMSSQTYLRIITDKSSYSKNLRSFDAFVINFNASYYGYQNPSISWNIDGDVTSGPTVIYSKAQSAVPNVIQVSCSISSVVNNMTYTTTTSMSINVIDITTYNLNYGVSEELLIDGPPYVEGDSYALEDDGNYIPYVYHNGHWVQVNESTISLYPSQMAQIRDSILSQGINIPKTSVAIYAYFKYASIQNAQIDTINTSQITLSDGGMIQSEVYNDTNGFRITSAGDATFVGSHVINSTVSGSFTSKPLETQDASEAGPVTSSLGSTAYYSDSEVYLSLDSSIANNQIVSVTGNVGSVSVNKALKVTDANAQSANRALINGIYTDPTTVSATVPVNTTLNIQGQAFKYSINTLGYSDIRTSVLQYKIGSGSWTNAPAIESVVMDTAIQLKHVVDTSDKTYGTYNNFQKSATEFFSSDFQYPNLKWNYWDCVISLGNGVLITKGKNNGVCRSTDNGMSWTTTYPAGQAADKGADGFLLAVPLPAPGLNLAIGYVELFNPTNSTYDIYQTGNLGDSWTKVYSGDSHYHSQAAYNYDADLVDLRIRAVGHSADGAPSGTLRSNNAFGSSWSFVSGTEINQIVYANGVWKSMTSGEDENIRYSAANNQLFKMVPENGKHALYSSTDGTNWALKHRFDGVANEYNAGEKPVTYSNGYYYVPILYTAADISNRSGIFASTDLTNWTNIYQFDNAAVVAYWFTTQGIIFVSGRLLSYQFEISGPSRHIIYNDFGKVTLSQYTKDQSGSYSATYSYALYPVGLNLIHDSSTLFSFPNDSSSWKNVRTVLSSPSYSGIPYYRFNQFTQDGSALTSFDFRSYTPNTTFNVKFRAFSGRNLNLTSPTSGDYFYNLKWSGTTFSVFLNGAQTGFFSTDDFFRNDSTYPFSVAFTPMGQLDAILVKDILPKVDSTYRIGEEGREFLSAHINDIYGNLHGDVVGDVVGDVTGDVIGNVSGNSGSSDRINSPDTRSTNPAPNTISKGLTLDFKSNSTIGISGHGTYSGVLTFRPYGSSTDFSGGPVHRIAFCEDGAIMHQTGNSSGWGSWSYPSTWN